MAALDRRTRNRYRRLGTSNLLAMGHCAPSVARTAVDLGHGGGTWLVKLAAGLPGGVGNCGGECGAVTAPLLVLGLQCAGRTDGGLPLVVDAAHAYCARFRACNGSLRCSDILGKRRVPLPCVKAVSRAPELLAETLASDAALPAGEREAYGRLWSHLAGNRFHCAHAVLRALEPDLPVEPELLAATAGFVGGTAMKGMTCSALVAGVMAVGLATAELEWSRPRVLRMLATMILGGNALDDGLNRFNRTVKRGRALVRWFEREHGSTQCREITRCAFSSRADVERYVREGRIARCKEIALRVADEARSLVASASAGPTTPS